MKMEKKQKRKLNKRKALWSVFKPVLVLLFGLAVGVFAVRSAVVYVLSNYFFPVDVNDPTPYEVVIPTSSSAGTIAKILYEACGYDQKGLIQNTAVFKVYVDFLGKANNLKAGTYVLSRNMSLKQIVQILCQGNPPKMTLTFTVPEGYTCSEIGNVLVEKGILNDPNEFLAACRKTAVTETFKFLPEDGSGRRFVTEGYLFPDTYEVYEDATADTVLVKMLNRFSDIYSYEYQERSAQLNMTMDEVVTLASLIEREAQADEDFAKVSAVFHNRLEQGMKLESCASLSYVLNEKKYVFSEDEMKSQSPYNTYLNGGLPCGPICNPGRKAMEAALYPEEGFRRDGYLYFCNGKLRDVQENGVVLVDNALVFAKTYEEHMQNVETYRSYWP